MCVCVWSNPCQDFLRRFGIACHKSHLSFSFLPSTILLLSTLLMRKAAKRPKATPKREICRQQWGIHWFGNYINALSLMSCIMSLAPSSRKGRNQANLVCRGKGGKGQIPLHELWDGHLYVGNHWCLCEVAIKKISHYGNCFKYFSFNRYEVAFSGDLPHLHHPFHWDSAPLKRLQKVQEQLG